MIKVAQKRMFDKRITDSDRFVDLPNSTKALYFMAGMNADDRGFFQPRRLQKECGFTDDDYKLLIAKKFFMTFESGVMVITDWNKNNYLDSKRLTETEYLDELRMLDVINGKYELKPGTLTLNQCLTDVKPTFNQNSIDKNSIDKNNIYTPFEVETSSGDVAKASKHKYGKYKHVLLKDEELQKLQTEYENYEELIDFLDEYIEMKGYKAKSHYLCIKKWVVDAVKQDHIRKGKYEATPTWKAESDNSWEEFRKSVGGDTNDTG